MLSSVTFPTSGSMRNGTISARERLTPPTFGNGRSYLPTPSVFMTTTARSHTFTSWGAYQAHLSDVVGGMPNPEWVEWLMGFPHKWSDCEASGIASFLPWVRSGGEVFSSESPKSEPTSITFRDLHWEVIERNWYDIGEEDPLGLATPEAMAAEAEKRERIKRLVLAGKRPSESAERKKQTRARKRQVVLVRLGLTEEQIAAASEARRAEVRRGAGERRRKRKPAPEVAEPEVTNEAPNVPPSEPEPPKETDEPEDWEF